jgi:hypothetical protein
MQRLDLEVLLLLLREEGRAANQHEKSNAADHGHSA